MEIREIVECIPTGKDVNAIRSLFCHESCEANEVNRNPLIETNFNDLLSEITQEAFSNGVRYAERKAAK